MAQVLIIKAETARDGCQYIGDIVGVFTDGHTFSETELQKFNVLTINGTVQDVQTKLDQIKPRIEDAYRWQSDNEYHWTPAPGGDNTVDSINVFRVEGDNKWYKAENDFLYPVTVDSLTPEEKQVLETVDINHPSVDSFIRKLVKNIAALSGNDVEIKELRNTEP